MKRRSFLKNTTAAVLAATPAMKAAAMLRDFGLPDGRHEWWIKIENIVTGEMQTRKIIGYEEATRHITVEAGWTPLFILEDKP